MKTATIISAIMILATTAIHAQQPADTAAARRITVKTDRYEGYQYYDTGQLFIMAHCMLESPTYPNYRVTFLITNKTQHPTPVKVPKFKARAEILMTQGSQDVRLYTHTDYLNSIRRAEVCKALWLYDLNSAEQRAATIAMARSAAVSDAYLDTCVLFAEQMVTGFVYVAHNSFDQRLEVTAHVGGRDYDFEWRVGGDRCAPVE